MTDPGPALERPELALRAARLRGARARTGAGRILAMGGFGLLLAGAAALLLAPDRVGALFGRATSEAEDLQRASRLDSGISTAITRTPDIETAITVEPAPALAPIPAPQPATLAPREDDALLEKLEELTRALGERPEADGLKAEDIAGLLATQAEQLRAENERAMALQRQLHAEQLAAARRQATETINAGLIGAQSDLAERERLEEARARMEAIRNEQIASDALVFDESEPGRATARPRQDGDVMELTDDEAFLATAADTGVDTARAARLQDPSRTIVQGAVLEATLETAVNTDLPGLIRAVLSSDAWSYDGTRILLPRGTRLIGTYSSRVNVAQRRALIAWTRAITPAGESIQLGSIGADALGRSGQTGFVDTRFAERFGSAALISIIGAAPVAIASDGDGGLQEELAEDIAGDFRRSTRSAVEDYLRIKPTIYIDQGTRMTVLVNRDLIFG